MTLGKQENQDVLNCFDRAKANEIRNPLEFMIQNDCPGHTYFCPVLQRKIYGNFVCRQKKVVTKLANPQNVKQKYLLLEKKIRTSIVKKHEV